MATGTSMSREEVKRTCNSLECSPSKSDSSGKAGGKPSASPGHRGEGKYAGRLHTSDLHSGKK